MRLLFLAKRKPQQRDLLLRPYGRFYYLPTLLSNLGHEVCVSLLSHHGLASEQMQREGVIWRSDDIRQIGIRRTLDAVEQWAVAYRPDWVVGCSDAWYGLLARRIAALCGARLAIDAYDNYEAYMRWNFPLHWKWRQSIQAADLVTAAGPQLADLLNRHRVRHWPAQIIPMSPDPVFIPLESTAARKQLGLPSRIPLIGYMGGWASNRGTDVLLEAFRLVRRRRPDAKLVLTGRPPKRALAEPGATNLGYLPDEDMPVALSAVNVACVITTNSAFGRYSYPAKLCEAMACEVPVVATTTEPVRWMLHDDARFLVPVGDSLAIAECILKNLELGRIHHRSIPGWDARAAQFDTLLRESRRPI